MVHLSPIPHQFIYVDDHNRTWASDCSCNEVVNIGAGGVYLNEEDEEIPHVIIDNEGGDLAEWYEIFPNNTDNGCLEHNIIRIELEKEAPLGDSHIVQNKNSSSKNRLDLQGEPFIRSDSTSFYDNNKKEAPLSENIKLLIHNWEIRQPKTQHEYDLMKALIENPSNLLLAPPHMPYILNKKVENEWKSFGYDTFSNEALQDHFNYFKTNSSLLGKTDDPKSEYILKSMFYFLNDKEKGIINSRYSQNLINNQKYNSFLVLLEEKLEDLYFQDRTVEKIRSCLGHRLFSCELKNRDTVREQSSQYVKQYERSVNVKRLITNILKRNRGPNDRRPYLMEVSLLHEDNFLGCNHYDIHSKVVSDQTYPLLGLDLLRNKLDERDLEKLAQDLLCFQLLDQNSSQIYSPLFLAEKATSFGCYSTAIKLLNQYILSNPDDSDAYLNRSAAYLGLENYSQSIKDFDDFDRITKKDTLTPGLDFTLGFIKELPKGIYESGASLLLMVNEIIQHPIHTVRQVYTAFNELGKLALSQEWETISQHLVPEVHELVINWNSLEERKKGELIGHIFGKYGADIFTGGLLVKGIKKVKGLINIRNSLFKAEQLVVVESLTALRNPAKIAEVIEVNQGIVAAGQELNMSAREMFMLKESGKLNKSLHQIYEGLFPSQALMESFELFQRAEVSLKPYRNKIMPEIQLRELIESAGIKTYPRPAGMPEHFVAKITNDGAGIKYIDPANIHNSVRLMPGKPHSGQPYQRNPYIIQMKGGKAFDRFGNLINHRDPAAHVPIHEFVYRE